MLDVTWQLYKTLLKVVEISCRFVHVAIGHILLCSLRFTSQTCHVSPQNQQIERIQSYDILPKIMSSL